MEQKTDHSRLTRLRKNPFFLFWTQVLLNVKIFNLVSTLFFVHRGLSLSQLVQTAIVWGLANLLFEVPSSYLADRWGRKKTLLLGISLFLLSDIIWFVSHSAETVMLGFFLNGMAFACFTGTDEALLYDSQREIGEEGGSLKKFAHYDSAQNVAKFATPFLAAWLAKDLLEWQFSLVLGVDVIASIIAFLIAMHLIEPHHRMDVEKREKGVFWDALKLLKQDGLLFRITIGRAFFFIASLMIWRVHQQFFVDKGFNLVILGACWSIYQFSLFVGKRKITSFLPSLSVERRIQLLHIIATAARGIFFVSAVFFPNMPLLVFLFFLADFFQVMAWPLYSEFFHKRSLSHNRATTVSMCHFVKSVLDLPLFAVASYLVGINIIYLFALSFVVTLSAGFFFRMPRQAAVPARSAHP